MLYSISRYIRSNVGHWISFYSLGFKDLISGGFNKPLDVYVLMTYLLIATVFKCYSIWVFLFEIFINFNVIWYWFRVKIATPCSIVRYHSKSIFYNNTFIILGLSPIPQTITFLHRVVCTSVCSCHFPLSQLKYR